MRVERFLTLSLSLACASEHPPAVDGSTTEESGAPDASTSDDPSTSGSAASESTTVGEGATTDPADSSGSSGSSGSSEGSEGGIVRDFVPYACLADPPDALSLRLCDEAADPEGAPDKVFIHCALEGSCQAPADPPRKSELLVMAWNIERGVSVDAQLAAFEAGLLPVPDVLLMSELDRGCTRTSDRNITWDYAAALEMNHVYGVEFVELPRQDGSITAPCEHGNAILSRYPIGNVELVRHAVNESWYEVADEPRLGGRMFLRADVLVGDRLVQVASLHFESGVEDGAKRAAQAAELADKLLESDDVAIPGGDTNAGLYALDLSFGTHNEGTTEAFFERGFADAHIELPLADRPTRANGLVLDLIFVRGGMASMPVVCPAEVCDALSDHRAVWATIAVE